MSEAWVGPAKSWGGMWFERQEKDGVWPVFLSGTTDNVLQADPEWIR